VRRLPARQREVIVLCVFLDLDIETTARGDFGISNDYSDQAINNENWSRVSCISTAACLAIVGTDSTLVGLADHVWSIEPTHPTHVTPTNISCSSSSMCIVVGRYHQQAASITPVFQPGPIKLVQTRRVAIRPPHVPRPQAR
jgi:hypothetical protein